MFSNEINKDGNLLKFQCNFKNQSDILFLDLHLKYKLF